MRIRVLPVVGFLLLSFPIAALVSAAVGFESLEMRRSEARTDIVDSRVPAMIAAPLESRSEPMTSGEDVRILFGGDMMFDRWIRSMMRKNGTDWALRPLRETFRDADAVVANLEGPITGNASVSERSAIGARENYIFTFDPTVADLLREFGVIANLGNNHIGNWKDSGVEETEAYLRGADVKFFGSPLSGSERYLIDTVSGLRVAFVSYNQFGPGDEGATVRDIGAARDSADFVVLYAHWGEEYVSANEWQRTLARAFIDAGADIVIGSHPHVVQESETYRGKSIYYSLGNLVFDQYFREDTRRGLMLSVSIDSGTMEYVIREIPVEMRSDGQTSIVGNGV